MNTILATNMDVLLTFQWVILLSFVVLLDAQTQSQTEAEINAVHVKFYQLSKSKWENGEEKFRQSLVDGANEFCMSNPEACGIDKTKWTKADLFDDQNVRIASAIGDRIYFSLQLYLTLPSKLDSSVLTKTKRILVKDATATIVSNSRKDLASGVGAPIVEIEEDKYTPSPNHTRNSVLICVAFFVTLVVSSVAIYFKVKENREHKQLRHKVMQEKQLGQSSSRENVAIVRPSGMQPPEIIVGEKPITVYSSPLTSNDNSPQKQERQSFLNLRGRQAPYAVPESSKIQSQHDTKVTYKPWKQTDRSGHETPV